MNIKFIDKMVSTTELPKNLKKITGTRFGSVLGVNPFSTPFKTWCEITKVYEEPFEDTIYTIAGKTIEPKQAEYIKQLYVMENLVTPTDKFGADYFNKTRGDFFKENEIFGGMWDYLFVDENGNPKTVLEMKTTKRAEDWEKEPPIYYQLQASLYAYLLGVDDVMLVASFLEDKDYEKPEKFKCTKNNTIVYRFSLKDKFPHFEDYVESAENWYKLFALTGESPDYTSKDEDIIKILKNSNLAPDTDMDAVIAEAEQLQSEINEIENSIADKQKRLDTLKNMIKQYCIDNLEENKTSATLKGGKYTWKLSMQSTKGIDKDALKRDGLLDKYNTKVTTFYKLTNKEN